MFRATPEQTIIFHTIEGWDLREEEDLEKCVEKWQKFLRLQDVDIAISLERFTDLDHGDSTANITINDWHKCATIYLLDPADYIPGNFTNLIWGYDMEDAVVHELLHIHMHPYTPDDRNSLEYLALEVCISTMAETLVTLDRARSLHTEDDKTNKELKAENARLKKAAKSMMKLLTDETNPIS